MTNNKRALSRRDVLKLTAATAGGALLAPLYASTKPAMLTGKPNIILLVFDAMSARHLSLYGYERDTTPNFARFARRATVYHSHYSGGNFTSAGTASMLTGSYPWTHRAINIRGLVKRSLVRNNIFRLLGEDYYRAGYSHNTFADFFLNQFAPSIEDHIPPSSYEIQSDHLLLDELFPNDYLPAYFAYNDLLNTSGINAKPASLTLGIAEMLFAKKKRPKDSREYPYGVPYASSAYYFSIAEVLNGALQFTREQARQTKPFFLYFHLLPPHAPYRPTVEFTNRFQDRGAYVRKPVHRLIGHGATDRDLAFMSARYDQFIANVDSEFGLFLDSLEKSGELDSTVLIVTSDHGELIERGMQGHGGPLLYDPLVHIPLLISLPGQQKRSDIFSTTSNADLMPTILSLAGRSIPEGLDGQILPGFGGPDQLERAVFTMQAIENSAFMPFTKATVAVRRGDYRLIRYLGYPAVDSEFELYDLKSDPQELNNLFGVERDTSTELKADLLAALAHANKPYQRGNQ